MIRSWVGVSSQNELVGDVRMSYHDPMRSKTFLTDFVAIAVISALIFAAIKYNDSRKPARDVAQAGSALQDNDTKMHNDKLDKLGIEILTEGTGAAVASGQTAVVDYTGTLTDGTVFDSSIPRNQPFDVHLGRGEVIQGWELGLVGMKVGEKRKLTIPPELGYGASGFPGVIPPNATLIFEVTLRAIK